VKSEKQKNESENVFSKACREYTITNNLYYNYKSLSYLNTTDIGGLDPLFVNASLDLETANFHLLQGSPAVGNGTATGLINDHDADGVVRPYQGQWDIGAYSWYVLRYFFSFSVVER
jgi:hypothetical protein